MNTTASKSIDLALAVARRVQARHPAGSLAWNYETGLILLALWKLAERTGDGELRAFVAEHARHLVDEAGSIRGYRAEEYNLDQINSGKLLLELYAQTGDERYAAAAAALRRQLADHPRTAAGGFWHKKIYPNQIWLDGLYMQAPFAVRWALMNGDGELAEDVCDQLVLAADKTRDPATGLLRHAWDESRTQLWADPATGRSPHPWGRAMGWYLMALADVLELLPAEHPRRTVLAELCAQVCRTVLAYRDGTTLLWFQILDQAGRPGNYPEASASAMFCYALAKAVRLGLLPREPAASAAGSSFAALTERCLAVDGAGEACLSGICKVAGLGGDPYRDGSFAYYVGEPVVSDDFKGTGPYILAALEQAASEA